MSIVAVGCDPGMDGAIAITVDTRPVRIFPMPTTTLTRRSNGRTRNLRSTDIDAATRLIQLAADYCDPGADPIVCIEKVAGRPGEAAGGAFRFGECYGALCSAASTLAWVWTVVTPQVWKPAVGLPVGSTKDDSRQLAQELWPDAADKFRRKKDHGAADACLIAKWRTDTITGDTT